MQIILTILYKYCTVYMVMKMDKRHENFKRVAEKRTNKIITLISLLGNLNNKSFYTYSEEEINEMFNAIEDELEKQKYRLLKKETKGNFRL